MSSAQLEAATNGMANRNGKKALVSLNLGLC